MRSEQEMFDLILRIARDDERVRAVFMNGSRANPKAPKDIFQDYDIVYVVRETASFIKDKEWYRIFGDILIIQLPGELDRISGKKVDFERCYTYLMQFRDGTRIDLRIGTEDFALEECRKDTLTVPLLDKDHILPELPPSNDSGYWVKEPTQELFYRCCNEFWWLSLYVAKGLCRHEILYAMEHLNCYMRGELITMLSWKVGIDTDFSVSIGKCGKYLDRYLSQEEWERLLDTFPEGTVESVWEALFEMCSLFLDTSSLISEIQGFLLPLKEALDCLDYCKNLQNLECK